MSRRIEIEVFQCSERMPKDGVDVLAFLADGTFVASRSVNPWDGSKCWDVGDRDEIQLRPTDWWAPLPLMEDRK